MKKILLSLLFLLLPFPANAAQVTATIANGASTSSAVNLAAYIPQGNQRAVGILMPAAWTTSSLIFLISVDGCNTFTELFDGNGNEYVVNAAAGEYILLDPSVFGYLTCFEVESVNYGSPPSVPVTQGAARVLTIMLQPIGGV